MTAVTSVAARNAVAWRIRPNWAGSHSHGPINPDVVAWYGSDVVTIVDSVTPRDFQLVLSSLLDRIHHSICFL